MTRKRKGKQTPTVFAHLLHLSVSACRMCSKGLGDEDAYRHMWAQCRSTGPGHWARPHTWWRWSRAACSLDCIQTEPPCQCQSHSLSAFQTGARGLSYTERRLSEAQLGIKEEVARDRERKIKGGGCVRQTGNREKERWQDKGGRMIQQSSCGSSCTSLVTHLLCQDRLFDSTSFCR